MKNKKIIYYWASNISNNNGEGILGDNFLKLMKINFKNYKFVSLNKFKYINQNTFFMFWRRQDSQGEAVSTPL